jgi:PKD repeat protein
LDEDLVYILYNERIRTIEDLASYNAKELFKKVNAHASDPYKESQEDAPKSQDNDQVKNSKYSILQIQRSIKKAQQYMGIDESELVTILKMDKDIAFKLYNCADIRTVEDLSKHTKENINKKLIICNEKVDEDKIEKYINAAIIYMKDAGTKQKPTPDAVTKQAPSVADFDADKKSGIEPLKVQFTDKSSKDTTSWQWDFGDHAGTSTQQNPSYVFAKAGGYDVVLTVSDGKGKSVQKHMQITVTPVQPVTPTQLIADFNADKTSDFEPLKVQFTAKSTGATFWQWNFGDHTEISKEQNPSHEFSKAGDYDVVLTVSDDKGKIDEIRKLVTVAEKPVPLTADFTADKTSDVEPLKVQFTAKSTGATFWQWNFGDQTEISKEHAPSHEFSKAGSYDVVFIVSDGKGIKEITKTITVPIPYQNSSV